MITIICKVLRDLNGSITCTYTFIVLFKYKLLNSTAYGIIQTVLEYNRQQPEPNKRHFFILFNIFYKYLQGFHNSTIITTKFKRIRSLVVFPKMSNSNICNSLIELGKTLCYFYRY